MCHLTAIHWIQPWSNPTCQYVGLCGYQQVWQSGGRGGVVALIAAALKTMAMNAAATHG